MSIKDWGLAGVLSLPLLGCTGDQSSEVISVERHQINNFNLEKIINEIKQFDRFTIGLFRFFKDNLNQSNVEISSDLIRQLAKTSYFPLADDNNYLQTLKITDDVITFQYTGQVIQPIPSYEDYLKIKSSPLLRFRYKRHFNEEGQQTHLALELMEGELETICEKMPNLNMKINRIVIGFSKEYKRSMAIANAQEKRGALIDIGKGSILLYIFDYQRLIEYFF